MADDDTIIPYHLVENATHRDVQIDEDTTSVWGLDVARFGTDKTALCKRQGPIVSEIMAWQGLDLMQTVGRVVAEYEALPPPVSPSRYWLIVLAWVLALLTV